MKNYLDMLRYILEKGEVRSDRTGTGTFSCFGGQLSFPLWKGFPIVTTKKVHFKSVVEELMWMLRGETNVKSLQAKGVTIWDEWADPETGELGRIYGAQWRRWVNVHLDQDGANVTNANKPIDQVKNLLDGIRKDPAGRRHIITAWNPAEVKVMNLPPCHMFMQFYVNNLDQEVPDLSCHMYIRSWDTFLGGPFNIAQYALLTHIFAKELDMGVGALTISGGDIHIYRNHEDQVRLQLTREPRLLPTLKFEKKDMFSYEFKDFELVGYDPYPAIKGEVSK